MQNDGPTSAQDGFPEVRAVIKQVGSKYVVMNEDGSKRLSKPMSKGQAEGRLRQIEYFKATKGKKMRSK